MTCGFNEAAGIPRGRHDQPVLAGCPQLASMRPRVFPAEDKDMTGDYDEMTNGFNEAAGIPRGRLPTRPSPDRSRSCFNEAAGIPRGRPELIASAGAIQIRLQ